MLRNVFLSFVFLFVLADLVVTDGRLLKKLSRESPVLRVDLARNVVKGYVGHTLNLGGFMFSPKWQAGGRECRGACDKSRSRG